MKTMAAMTAALAVLATATGALAGDVVVNMAGVKASGGPLYVSLQTKAQFLRDEGAYGQIIAAPQAGAASVVLKNVAPGEYSVSVWHDVNSNKVFDRAADGRPLDGWSMNNAASLRGEPAFDDVKFTVGAAGITLNLDMFYSE